MPTKEMMLDSIKDIFLQYVSLSDRSAIIVLFVGVAVSIAGLAIYKIRLSRRLNNSLLLLALLPAALGTVGSVATIIDTNEASVIERKAGMEPSAGKYYDRKYGYLEGLRLLFPFLMGLFSSALPLLLFALNARRIHLCAEEALSADGDAGRAGKGGM